MRPSSDSQFLTAVFSPNTHPQQHGPSTTLSAGHPRVGRSSALAHSSAEHRHDVYAAGPRSQTKTFFLVLPRRNISTLISIGRRLNCYRRVERIVQAQSELQTKPASVSGKNHPREQQSRERAIIVEGGGKKSCVRSITSTLNFQGKRPNTYSVLLSSADLLSNINPETIHFLRPSARASTLICKGYEDVKIRLRLVASMPSVDSQVSPLPPSVYDNSAQLFLDFDFSLAGERLTEVSEKVFRCPSLAAAQTPKRGPSSRDLRSCQVSQFRCRFFYQSRNCVPQIIFSLRRDRAYVSVPTAAIAR